ncbi:vasodilator-stimulated phosphoprotein-like [Onychostruthus taczanowskii]|uniref:vasodilator-stimulated phosphoprotein-like n=1 Tax=Onychostruthus taczanowskii TaxID=356909 RepID=UPI001B8070A3|nr:vasodilator-stimulated phosphoprotein-like [Onychostruthus taczanowskii]
MLRYFYPGKERKDTQQNFRAGGHDSTDFIPRLQRRFRRSAAPGLAIPAVTCPPEAPGPPPPPETKFCSALTAIVPRVGVSQNFASGGSSPPPVPAPGPPASTSFPAWEGKAHTVRGGEGSPLLLRGSAGDPLPEEEGEGGEDIFFLIFFLINTQNASPQHTPPPSPELTGRPAKAAAEQLPGALPLQPAGAAACR